MHAEFWLQSLKGRDYSEEPRRRWKYNIRVYHKEITWEGLDWIYVDQDMDCWRAVVNTVMNIPVS
jgi:hypothetical protein